MQQLKLEPAFSPERLDQGLALRDQPPPPLLAHAEERDEEVQARRDARPPGVALSHLQLPSKRGAEWLVRGREGGGEHGGAAVLSE